MNNREYLYEVVISGSPAGITGIQAANMVELIDDAGKVVWRRAEQVPGLSAIEGNPAVAGLLDTLNVQAITALDARTQERDAAVLAKQTAESQRDTALARVQQLEAQLAAPAVRFIKKWQLRAGMRKDDPSGALLAAFDSVIAGLPPAVRDLYDGSTGIEEDSPFVSLAKAAPMSLTDAQIASMFDRYPKITQADVLAMVQT
jgi:hypothetical protein